MDDMKEFQRFRDLLRDIIDSINAAENIQQVIGGTKDYMLNLFSEGCKPIANIL